MNVSTWAIKNPLIAVMIFVLLTLAGMLSFNSMKVQNFPDLDLPIITISASLPGAAPAQMETEVARKLENSVAAIDGLKHITTRVYDGLASVSIEFRLEKSAQEALDDVRAAVAQIRGDLPSDLNDPIISKLNLSGQPILAYTLASPQWDDETLSWFIDNTLTRSLLAVKGVGAVSRVGGVTRQVQVLLNVPAMQSYGITAAEVSRQLKQIQQETGAGRTDLSGSEQTVRALGTVASAKELGQLQLSLGNGRTLRLEQVATIKDTVAEIRSAAYLDGQPVIGFEISRSKGASEIEVAAGVTQVLQTLQTTHPELKLSKSFDFVEPVEQEYNSSLTLLYEGALLAVLVVWLFLRSPRATVVSAVALPLSVIPAFIGMNYLGFSINVVTLLSLSLVIGILVDDAIVEVENIMRHLRMGKTPMQAAIDAADEIGLAVIATTFTLIAVFLPTAFMSGIVGKFFKQFGWTASLAVFASLVVARLLTPMMAAYMLSPKDALHNASPRWLETYMHAARWCLQHRFITLLSALGFFIGSIMLIPLLPTGFIPPDDNSQTQIYLELAPGSTLPDTQRAAEQARQIAMKNPHVQSVYTTIGGGSAGSDPFAGGAVSEVRKAALTIQLTERGQRPRKQVIENELRRELVNVPAIRSKVGLGGSGEKYLLVLSGEDAATLYPAALAVEKEIRQITGVGSVSSNASLTRPELVVRTDNARAADLGVTTAAIGDTLRIATNGDYSAQLPKLNLSQRQVPIVVRLEGDARQNLDLLQRLTVPTAQGPVLLSQVANFELDNGPAVLNRYDRSRNVTIEVELSTITLGELTQKVAQLPSMKQLPADVREQTVGDAEVMGELFASFGVAMLTGVLCIYIVLVLLFKDFLHPFTILAALPLSLGGAFVGLLLAQKSFSMPSLIGLIMLMGVATKNSILLVEYAILSRRQGMDRLAALLDACHKRARPIIMTTIAMAAGMMPIALGWGDADTSFRAPMAIAVIGGLMTSTVLSLLVIPVVFTYLDDLLKLFQRTYWRNQWQTWQLRWTRFTKG